MSTEFEREERYIVFKLSDVEEHFTPSEKQQLARLVEVQRAGREEGGKPLLRCVVVEKDWPEYEPTWKAIEARVTGAQPAPSFADAYQGAMEEVAIWKRRALEAETLNRKFVAEINGPAYMGEPAQPAPSIPEGWKLVPIEPTVKIRKAMHYAYWKSPQLPYHDGSPELWNAAYAAMLAAAPETKP